MKKYFAPAPFSSLEGSSRSAGRVEAGGLTMNEVVVGEAVEEEEVDE